MFHRAPQEAVEESPHLGSGQPMGEALQFTLGGNTDLIQRIDQTEPLIKRIAGQLAAEAAKIILQESPQERAPQSPAGALLMFELLLDRGLTVPGPLFKRPLHEVSFHSAVAQ